MAQPRFHCSGEQPEPQVLPSATHLCQLTVQPTEELVVPTGTVLPPFAATKLQGIQYLAGLVTWALPGRVQNYREQV